MALYMYLYYTVPVSGEDVLSVSTEGSASRLRTLKASVHSSLSTIVAQLNVMTGSSPRTSCGGGAT